MPAGQRVVQVCLFIVAAIAMAGGTLATLMAASVVGVLT